MGEQYTADNAKLARQVVWPTGLNCYSFAAKCAAPGGSGTTACVPGAKGGNPVTQHSITKLTLHHACVADGFVDVSSGVTGSDHILQHPPPCDGAHYLIAVFYDTLRSFHFARHLADDSAWDRTWVHKPSAQQDALNLHNGWLLLDDISNVPWGPRFEFVSYLRAPKAGIQVNRGNF